jgi:hypothetical protein
MSAAAPDPVQTQSLSSNVDSLVGALTAPRSVPSRTPGPSLNALLQVHRDFDQSRMLSSMGSNDTGDNSQGTAPPASQLADASERPTKRHNAGPASAIPGAAAASSSIPATSKQYPRSQVNHDAALSTTQAQAGGSLRFSNVEAAADAFQRLQPGGRGRRATFAEPARVAARPSADANAPWAAPVAAPWPAHGRRGRLTLPAPHQDSPLDDDPQTCRESGDKSITPCLSLGPLAQLLAPCLSSAVAGDGSPARRSAGSELSFAQRLSPTSLVGSAMSRSTAQRGSRPMGALHAGSKSPDAALQGQPEADFHFPNPPDANAPLFGSQSLMPGMDCSQRYASAEIPAAQPLTVQQSVSKQSLATAMSQQSMPSATSHPSAQASAAADAASPKQQAHDARHSSMPEPAAAPGTLFSGSAPPNTVPGADLLGALHGSSCDSPDSVFEMCDRVWREEIATPAAPGAATNATASSNAAVQAQQPQQSSGPEQGGLSAAGAAMPAADPVQILPVQKTFTAQSDRTEVQGVSSDAAPQQTSLLPQKAMRSTAEEQAKAQQPGRAPLLPQRTLRSTGDSAPATDALAQAQKSQQAAAAELNRLVSLPGPTQELAELPSTSTIPQRPMRSTAEAPGSKALASTYGLPSRVERTGASLIAAPSLPQRPMRSTADAEQSSSTSQTVSVLQRKPMRSTREHGQRPLPTAAQPGAPTGIPAGTSIPRTPLGQPPAADAAAASAAPEAAEASEAPKAAVSVEQVPLAPTVADTPLPVVAEPLQAVSPAIIAQTSNPFARMRNPFAPRQMLRRSDEVLPNGTVAAGCSQPGSEVGACSAHDGNMSFTEKTASASGATASGTVDLQPASQAGTAPFSASARSISGAQSGSWMPMGMTTLAAAAPVLSPQPSPCGSLASAPPPVASPPAPPAAANPNIVSPALPHIHTRPFHPALNSRSAPGGSPAPGTPPPPPPSQPGAAPFAVSVRQSPSSPAYRVGCFPPRATSLQCSPASPMVFMGAASPLASPRVMTHVSLPASQPVQNAAADALAALASGAADVHAGHSAACTAAPMQCGNPATGGTGSEAVKSTSGSELQSERSALSDAGNLTAHHSSTGLASSEQRSHSSRHPMADVSLEVLLLAHLRWCFAVPAQTTVTC